MGRSPRITEPGLVYHVLTRRVMRLRLFEKDADYQALENGIMERTFRTFRERLEGEALENLLQARNVMARIVHGYNEERLHGALGYLRPVDYYQGDPDQLQAVRRQKLAQARHRRREENLQLRQRTLPLSSEEVVACG